MPKNIDIERMCEDYYNKSSDFNKMIVDEYLSSITHTSIETKKQYTSAAKIYVSWITKYCNNKSLSDLKPLDFLRYQNWLLEMGLKTNAIRFKRSVVSNINEHIITYHPEFPTFRNYITKSIKIPDTGKVYEKVPVTEDEYEKLCKYLEDNKEWQKLAYLKFTYISGCRKSESWQLLKSVINAEPIEKMTKIKDEEGNTHEVMMKKYKTHKLRAKGKGIAGKERRLSFDEDVMFYLKKWIEERGEDNCPYMFVIKTKDNEARHINKTTFNDWCDEFGKILGGRRLVPHNLRMSRASNLALSGKSLESIQSLLGHASIDVTKIYIVKDDDSEDEDEIFAD